MTKLGAWGARSPIRPESQEIGPDSIVLALRSLFDPEAAGEVDAAYELRIGEERFRVEDRRRRARARPRWRRGSRRDRSPSPTPPPSPPSSPASSPSTGPLASGAAQIEGSKQAAKRFLRLFPMPEPCECAGAEPALQTA